MLNISQVILMRTDSNLCRKELTVHWSAPNSLIRSYLQPCTNSMWGDKNEAVAPIICLYQIVDAQKEEVCFPELLITLRSYGATVRKRPIWVNIDFLSCVTLQLDVWPWKTIEHLFYATSSFVHHFVAIGDFKLEIQSETPNLGQTRRFLEPCNIQIWQMTLKNNKAPLLCYFKLCAAFHSHWWIQTGVTVRKRPIWVKFDDF